MLFDTFSVFATLLDGWEDINQQLNKSRILDIVVLNLICDLLLEAKLTTVLPTYEGSLRGLREKYSGPTPMDATNLSRYPLKDFPFMVKYVFGINKNKNVYEIKTYFPWLLMALVESQNMLPFIKRKEKQVHTTWSKDKSFFAICIGAIEKDSQIKPICEQDKIVSRYIEYYAFERLFRTKTKAQLFSGQISKKEGLLTLEELAGIYFPSPIVFIPDYDEENYISQSYYSMEYMRWMILFSSYWFPLFRSGVKYYIAKKNLKSYVELFSYIFSSHNKVEGLAYQNQLFENFGPEKLLPYDLNRGKQLNDYNNKWREFLPPDDFQKDTYRPLTLKKSEGKIFPAQDSLTKDGPAENEFNELTDEQWKEAKLLIPEEDKKKLCGILWIARKTRQLQLEMKNISEEQMESLLKKQLPKKFGSLESIKMQFEAWEIDGTMEKVFRAVAKSPGDDYFDNGELYSLYEEVNRKEGNSEGRETE